MSFNYDEMISKVNSEKIWDSEPVFCYTTDIDWASESALDIFFSDILETDLKLTVFVTHKSEQVKKQYDMGRIERGIHPNFLANSSHGNSFKEVIDTCVEFAPESKCFRSHRGFDATDTSHLLRDHGFEYDSNIVTVFPRNCRPLLHESGLIRFPLFWEDGTHLSNKLELNFEKYKKHFDAPGIKIISIHPMNYVVNPPTLKYMRNVKDTHTREQYNTFNKQSLMKFRYENIGIYSVIKDIIKFSQDYKIMSLKELYNLVIS